MERINIIDGGRDALLHGYNDLVRELDKGTMSIKSHALA